MTDKRKDLAWLLLQPHHYLVKTTNTTGRIVYKVYDRKKNPVQYFSVTDYKYFFWLFKKDHKNRMTLNLSRVRQLNGNNYLKVLYKKRVAPDLETKLFLSMEENKHHA
jgi:hypothetical protein